MVSQSLHSGSETKTVSNKEEINQLISQLEKSLTGELFKDLEIRDQIHKLKMLRDGVSPETSFFECIGCGS